ncbi:hypothetical protein EVAR_60817_1 [Eumeta japonica]|uniref:Uncharacterized protein n=1 Tax=Eumeta variegata TaxID=151549 RepID=A0A4C1ZZ97_EUMVA|nr:hypothetical protein EVAR_60817_1 [Eumeta japonica]
MFIWSTWFYFSATGHGFCADASAATALRRVVVQEGVSRRHERTVLFLELLAFRIPVVSLPATALRRVVVQEGVSRRHERTVLFLELLAFRIPVVSLPPRRRCGAWSSRRA